MMGVMADLARSRLQLPEIEVGIVQKSHEAILLVRLENIA
jgi:hypothetical protein